jgi:hypothetical protein
MKKIPDVIALGSSQTMELRATHLRQPPGSFFNHSVAAGNLRDMIAILGCYKIKGHLPKKIIIGVSVQVMFVKSVGILFSKRWEALAGEYYYLQALIEKRNPFIFELFLRAEAPLQEYKLLFSFSYALTNFKNIKCLLENGHLFSFALDSEHFLRTDGSYHFKREYTDAETVRRVQAFTNDLKMTKGYEIINKDLFVNFIDYILNCGSEVIFFLPPYHPMYYEELSKHKALGLYRELEKLIMDIAISRHIPICGSYDPNLLGLESKDFLDPWHLREYSVKKIFDDFPHLPSHTFP